MKRTKEPRSPARQISAMGKQVRVTLDGRCTSTILSILRFQSYALLDEQVRRARSDDGRL